MKLNIDLSTLALILWAGMLIISGSIWVLCSQVRRLADILDERAKAIAATDSGRPQNAQKAVQTQQNRVARVSVSARASRSPRVEAGNSRTMAK
ncbi:MAG TPA: hypothetical protein VGZ22_22200 [Isosphaeraceae bacterium]|nr:hypothetical protein [Isosphaeraceae bacterium]